MPRRIYGPIAYTCILNQFRFTLISKRIGNHRDGKLNNRNRAFCSHKLRTRFAVCRLLLR